MGNVKLKVNLIIEGVLIKFGTIVDEDRIPLRLRKKKYIIREGEKDYTTDFYRSIEQEIT
jgi:hypothetical protein